MSFVYNSSKSKEPISQNSISISEAINFPSLKLFAGDAGKDPFFDHRMKASVIAMAQFLDFLDQTESYKYYFFGKKLKEASYYGHHKEEHKNLILCLGSYSYFFEKETLHQKTIFKKDNWVRASLNELDLWPKQFEIHYEHFISSKPELCTNPIYRRVEVRKILPIYTSKLETFSLSEEEEWSHLWDLIQEEYSH